MEKDKLLEYQDDKLRGLTKLNDFPCRIKSPVVRLIDCSYIKALLNPKSNQTFQSYKLHCEFLHVALRQRKDLPRNQDMGQNDLNCSSNAVQAERSLFQTNILVGKRMCHNRNTSQRCQNGKKRFRESTWCLESKKTNKKMKMTEDLERSTIQKVLSNMDLYNECRLQIDGNTIADPSIITEELNYSETISLQSFGVPDFLLKRCAQEHPNQLVTLPGNKQKSDAIASYNASDFEKSELQKENDSLESKTVEPPTDFSTMKDDSRVTMQVSEKITNCSNNIVGCMQGSKAAPKGETLSKTRKILLFSCRRIVPFSGKNIWPRESCARTSLWFCKDHVSGSEFLRGTDSFVVQMELRKLSLDTSKVPENKTADCKTELSVESPATESQLDTPKAFSDIGNKNGISSKDMEMPKQCPSTDMEIPKQCLSGITKNAKKCKIISDSLVEDTKNEKSVVKRNVSTGTQNCRFVDSNKNKTKSWVTKPETAIPQVQKTLSKGKLSRYRIPLLKDNGVLRNPQNILDLSAASLKKDRSVKVTEAAVEEHADQFDSSVAESFPRESSVCSKDLASSLESDIELSTLKDTSNSLSTGCTKKPTGTPVSSENNENNWSNTLAQDKDKSCADVLKAYEDDALVIDVIQDDPDLFGSTVELEVTGSEKHVTGKYCSIPTFSEEKLELRSESSQFPRNSVLEFKPE